MFIHTRGSAPKRFAKFGRQKRTFCGKKLLAKSSQIDYRTLWLLGAFSGSQSPGRNGIVPQADRPAHQEG